MKKTILKIVAGLSAIAMMAGVAVMATPETASAQILGGGSSLFGGSDTYTVKSGDTLSAIALRFYGDASLFPRIAAANNLTNPNLIVTGQELVIPSVSGTLGGSSNLGDLLILGQLFGDDSGGILGGGDGDSDLGDLIILGQLFGGNGLGGGTTDGVLNGGSGLGDLIILDMLFNDDGGGMLGGVGGEDNDLGDLLILQMLFGK